MTDRLPPVSEDRSSLRATAEKLLARSVSRSKWYRQRCDGLDAAERNDYLQMGEIFDDVADDLDALITTTSDLLAALALPAQLARYTVQPPAWAQRGEPPVETTHPCLYTQVRPCKQEHPTDEDRWCGYCRGTHDAVKLAALPAQGWEPRSCQGCGAALPRDASDCTGDKVHPRQPVRWYVTVERDGEQVVTIGYNHLSGRDISSADEQAIHTAALSLLGFIGHATELPK